VFQHRDKQKDYLQLEGVVYKLVPIRTPVNPRNPFDMGRIDGDKMYDIVMNWDWGNSGDPSVYHDVETRRNGITYRSNIARLAETLLNEGKKEKAEQVLDLAMEKMPVDTFEYYSLLEPFVSGYYEVDKPEKARQVFKDVSKIYQEKLLYYSGLKIQRQYGMADEIISDMEKYRGLIDIIIAKDTEEMARQEANEFNNYLSLFRHFYSEEEGMDVDKDLQQDSVIEIPLDSQAIESTESSSEN
jgi:hypothetical protein